MNIKVEVSDKVIVDLITTACEQGSGYWARLMKHSVGRNNQSVYDLPIDDGWIEFAEYDPDAEEHVGNYILNKDSIKSGFKLMAEKYPWHFSDIMRDNWDAETADVFLQLSVLGEIVYG